MVRKADHNDVSQAYAAIRPDGRSASIVVEASQLIFRYANFDGRILLQRGYPARLSRGVLHIASERAAPLFREAMSTVRRTSSPTMIVSDGDHGPFSIRISVWAPPDPAGSTGSTVAILDFRAGSFELTDADLRAIGIGFGLTEAEMSVLGYLAGGLTLAQIARRRDVDLETVRRQCKTVLAKMGCHRQVDLIRLMISLCAAPSFTTGG